MSIARDFLADVIRPTLAVLDMDGEPPSLAVQQILLGTAAQESGFKAVRQDGGPALSKFEIEPATWRDCVANYLNARHDLSYRVLSLLDGAAPSPRP